jgi:hypothetical protein
LTVNPSARVHNAQLFLKNGESITSNPLLRLSTYSEVNDYLDETVITFDEESTINFDGQFDAYKMTGLEEAPQLYSITVDMIELSINSMPAVDENMIVPLNYKVGISGIYTIEATEMLNFTGATDIILEDKKEGTFINLTEQNTYSFAADPSDDVERFNVYFYFNPSTEIETMALSNLHIFTSQHKLILESLTNDVLSGQLLVYTLLGQQVAGEKVNAGLKYETEIQEEGIYIVTFYNQQDQKQYRQKIQIR